MLQREKYESRVNGGWTIVGLKCGTSCRGFHVDVLANAPSYKMSVACFNQRQRMLFKVLNSHNVSALGMVLLRVLVWIIFFNFEDQ